MIHFHELHRLVQITGIEIEIMDEYVPAVQIFLYDDLVFHM